MKTVLGVVLVAGSLLAAGAGVRAQAPASKGSSPSNPSGTQQKPASPPAATPPPSNSNAFPEDESSVPVLPSKDAPQLPPGSFDGSVNGRAVLPAGDIDPVESPDEPSAAANGSGPDSSSSSSSSLSGIDTLMPGPDDEQPGKHGHKQDQIEPEHKESAAEDENVGKYYLDNKDWRAALSRFQSAMVLDPDNPDVYWGLAESNLHLQKYSDARANYLKVIEYDPDSKHAKQAKKALEEPELENIKQSAAQSQP